MQDIDTLKNPWEIVLFDKQMILKNKAKKKRL